MKKVSVLIKPASSLCQLRCKYCFYANVSSLREVKSYGKMKLDTAQKLIDNVYKDLEDGDELSIAFQGGEPTLAGLKFFESFVAYLREQSKKVQVNFAIQTNGILINEKWCQFLKENHFLVGLSIDGNETYHNLYRVDDHQKGTYSRVLQAKELFDEYSIDYNVLCVLTNPLAKEAKKVFRFLLDHHIEYVQFIPCLNDLESTERNEYALTPKRFASFYKQLLHLWIQELEEGNYISIKLFDDVFNLLVNHQVNACGLTGHCGVQYVIEADGSVYPCDFYVLDEYRLGYIQEETLKELFNKENAMKFICSRQELPSYCLSCPYKALCGGGCKRMEDAMYVNKENNFCGYQTFLKDFLNNLEKIDECIRKIQYVKY